MCLHCFWSVAPWLGWLSNAVAMNFLYHWYTVFPQGSSVSNCVRNFHATTVADCVSWNLIMEWAFCGPVKGIVYVSIVCTSVSWLSEQTLICSVFSYCICGFMSLYFLYFHNVLLNLGFGPPHLIFKHISCWCKIFCGNSWYLKVTAFSDIAPCSIVEVDQHFRGAYCLKSHLVEVLLWSPVLHPRFWFVTSDLWQVSWERKNIHVHLYVKCHSLLFTDYPFTEHSLSSLHWIFCCWYWFTVLLEICMIVYFFS
jgi:hypothetical protein